MKRLLITVAVLLLCMGTAQATPPEADRYKADLIGSNDTSFFYYLTYEELPGSYFLSYTHYYLVSRNIRTGKIEKKIHLMTTKNIGEESEGGLIDKYEHPFVSDINPMTVIRENSVEALYPDTDAPRDLRFDRKGMYYLKDKKRVELLSRDYLDIYLDGYDDWLEWKEGVRVVQVYFSGDYFYYLLQYSIDDINFYQVILPVSTKIIYSLRD